MNKAARTMGKKIQIIPVLLIFLFVPLLMLFLDVVSTQACTVFSSQDSENQNFAYVAKSYDWSSEVGMVIANMPGITKLSLNFNASGCDAAPEQPMTWTSKYGSLTFNQFGRDLPNGGMNEHGLVAEMAEMDPLHTKQPDPSNPKDAKNCYVPEGAAKSLNTQQWLQYVLDSFKTVDEVRNDLKDKAYALVPYMVSIHYMVCDTDECAIIEIGRDGQLREYYPDDPSSDPLIPSTYACPLGDPGLDPGIEEYLGCNPTIELDDESIVSPNVLTNDYYYCSVNALSEYQGFGGEQDTPTAPFCLDEDGKKKEYCDICRTNTGAWADSNSIERFVRASNNVLYEQNIDLLSVDNMFESLNAVISSGEGANQTGGTVWQIVYDMLNKEIHWRTKKGGQDSEGFFNGTPHSLGIDDVVFSECSQASYPATDNTKVMNIDGGGIMQPYSEGNNRNLVKTAAEKSLPHTLENFKGFVQAIIRDIEDDKAKEIIYNIWGGYPRGYTTCGRDVMPEDEANLFLSSVLEPYINPYIKDNLGNNIHYTKGKTKCTDSSCGALIIAYNLNPLLSAQCDAVYYSLDTYVSGLKSTFLTDLGVENDTLPFTGELPILSSYNTDLHLYCKHGSAYNIFGTKILSAGYYNMGKIDMTFALLETDFDGQAKGVEISDDLSDPFCFNKADTEVTELNLNSKDLKLYKCDYTYFWPTINVDPLCELILQYAKPTIFSKAESEVKIELKSILSDNFKQCGVTSVAPPNPLELSVDWGMADGQYVTAYSGRTYLLEAYVGANQDSFSSEHVIFTDGHPEEETSTLIVAARINSIEESNLVTALWTPDKLGETQLYVDASRLNEQTDGVEPAVLKVRVLPAEEDPSSSQDIIPLVDSQGGGGNSNCFIATAAYGSYWEPHVRTLRQFRDSYLLTNKFGAQFVEAYYKYSPPMANYIAEHDNLRSVARVWFAPLVGFSWLAVNYGIIIAFAVLFGVLTMIIGTTCLVVKKREAS